MLQYVFRQHNIKFNVLLQHVSTQESHRQADYLRRVNTLRCIWLLLYVDS